MVGPFAWFKWEALFSDWTVFAEGFKTTILVAILSLALALALGIVFGVLGASQWKLAKVVSRIYVEFIQNTPLVIQVLFLYNGLPHMGIMIPIFAVGVLGVGVYHGAYVAEVVRAGINSIHRGQMEAALSQGFTFWGAMRHIILPQASRVVLPPLTNQAVNLIKNTSVLAMVAGGDLMYRADSWSSGNIYYGPAYVTVGLLYLILCLPLALLTRRLEAKMGVAP
ncbi:amine acid ABC transporter, permease protein, 3-TM region, His/Glu/Gln/Arg/opine family [Desulfosporosinus orientis DSM 765]|uniref:Amine acid ABC transporter, permease protein, 3-TM region, His/Glu/Gln/Arg/opine family n=1 Tax=Desulfosporosinus orientis (strain ATCC 19365 / DSM 765 / NCIMB 8382 / VKM B-1628 / Singapore I) TaxID=768706 RepID=G7WA94_DESOD|nr:amino acid ABC transporter permease [Desulfosporosinus orientis]AET66232.1 amine acid ABC transporter, permease protein, 3-TM region, His/Glu/Gln/Arg/opine family [Desulfosporosinus orientis DSM 765]